MEECCCQKTKVRTDEEYKSLMNRLNRIEGQIRGLKGMLEKNAYCPDILTQAAAANAAVNARSCWPTISAPVSRRISAPGTTR